MQKYEAIENGIANNDIKALREAIGSICYTCRDFSDGEFDEAVRGVESRGIKIKDDRLIGNPVTSSQKTAFTDEDFAKAVFELKKNFCDERIADVKKIGTTLYGAKPVTENLNKVDAGTDPNVNSHQQKSNMMVVLGMVALIIILIIVLLVKR